MGETRFNFGWHRRAQAHRDRSDHAGKRSGARAQNIHEATGPQHLVRERRGAAEQQEQMDLEPEVHSTRNR